MEIIEPARDAEPTKEVDGSDEANKDNNTEDDNGIDKGSNYSNDDNNAQEGKNAKRDKNADEGNGVDKVNGCAGNSDFLQKIPIDIRLLIYRQLAPNKEVPTIWQAGLRTDEATVSTAIFRVCKAIHHEFTEVFYGETSFNVTVLNDVERTDAIHIRTCFGSVVYNPDSAGDGDNAALLAHVFAPLYFDRIQEFEITVMFNTDRCDVQPPSTPPSQEAWSEIIRGDRAMLSSVLHIMASRMRRPLRRVRIALSIEYTFAEADHNAGYYYGRSHTSSCIEEADREIDNEARDHCRALLDSLRGLLRARRVGDISCVRNVTQLDGDPVEINFVPEPEGEEVNLLPSSEENGEVEEEEKDNAAAAADDDHRVEMGEYIQAFREQINGLLEEP
jgi:hypothetical protein